MPSWQAALLPDSLRRDVVALAGEIGERHMWRPEALAAAAEHIERELRHATYEPIRQTFAAEGQEVFNIEVDLRGTSRPEEIVLVGAHYDSYGGKGGYGVATPGADDNASGVAGVLALARALAGRPQPRTMRFVFFVNEEPPFTGTDLMGSRRYARRCRQRREKLTAVISLDSIGCFSDQPGSQRWGVPLLRHALGSRANFIAFLTNRRSQWLLRRASAAFRRRSRFPLRAHWLPLPLIRRGWSDDWSFWPEGYEAFAVTDTAYLRYPHYHQPSDTPDKLDYARMAAVVDGVRGMTVELAAE